MPQPSCNGVIVGITPTKLTVGPSIALTVWNNDPGAVLYVSTDPLVTIASGFPIQPKTAYTFDYSLLAAYTDWWGVVASGTLDARLVARV